MRQVDWDIENVQEFFKDTLVLMQIFKSGDFSRDERGTYRVTFAVDPFDYLSRSLLYNLDKRTSRVEELMPEIAKMARLAYLELLQEQTKKDLEELRAKK